MNAEAPLEFISQHALSLPTWVWIVLAGVTLANAAGVAFAFYLARRAIAAANKSDASCRQAELYHNPPVLWDAVKRAEAAAKTSEALASKWTDGTLGPTLQFAGEDPKGTGAPERLVTALEKIAVTAVQAANRCDYLLERMEDHLKRAGRQYPDDWSDRENGLDEDDE